MTSSGLTSANPSNRFAVLLPLTSRGSSLEEIESRLNGLLHSMTSSSPDDSCSLGAQHQHQPALSCLDIFVGIDKGDPLYDSIPFTASPGMMLFHRLCSFYGISSSQVHVFVLTYPPGSICRIWCFLSRQAYQFGSSFMVLLGDDVIFHTPDWTCSILYSFQLLHNRPHYCDLPFGFGCVAVFDRQAPGFPTFPVLHRSHFDMFESHLLTCEENESIFINQDADPFLFSIYQRWNSSLITDSEMCCLSNTIGGFDAARYTKKHCRWQDHMLVEAVAKMDQYLRKNYQPGIVDACRVVVIDVVVPTYRLQYASLESITNLSIPSNAICMFIIIVDNPKQQDQVAELVDYFSRKKNCRIRVNVKNEGASFSRTRGIYESSAEWILFLDDDVKPQHNLLYAYVQRIRQQQQLHPDQEKYGGFVGLTRMPQPSLHSPYELAISLQDVIYWWHISTEVSRPPWGVTANLCVRRYDEKIMFFDPIFPKTGGGEDIDLCLRLPHRLCSAPEAVAHHPWWQNGFRQVYGWAAGDGILVDKYPQFAYRWFPDAAQCFLIYFLLLVLGQLLALIDLIQPSSVAQNVAALLSYCSLTSMLWIGVAEYSFVYYEHYNSKRFQFHRASICLRFLCYCSIVQLSFYSHFGRLVGHISRNGVIRYLINGYIGIWFDWSCGAEEMADFVISEKWKYGSRFVAYMIVPFLWLMWFLINFFSL